MLLSFSNKGSTISYEHGGADDFTGRGGGGAHISFPNLIRGSHLGLDRLCSQNHEKLLFLKPKSC